MAAPADNNGDNITPKETEAWSWERNISPLIEKLPSVHPGHVLLSSSLPFLWTAYRGFQKPLAPLVQNVLKETTAGKVQVDNLKAAEENIRRVVGSTVASRALRVASAGTIGVFGLVGALVFYSTGCRTFEQAVTSAKSWAQASRRRIDGAFAPQERIEAEQRELLEMRGMTEEEEMAYVSKKYFSKDAMRGEDSDTKS
jgi:hypothetical protein